MRRTSLFFFAVIVTIIALGYFWKNQPIKKSEGAAKTSTNETAASTNRQVYRVAGVVKELISPKRAKIAHEEVPGYMPAMTMPLDVKDTNEFNGIKAGDKITFDLVITADDGWIERISRVGETNTFNTIATNAVPKMRRVRDVDQLSVGDKMPDYPFITEEKKPLKLSDLKGQAVAITFIFTRCPFPNFCPRMTSNFAKIAHELSQPGSPTNWHMLSISFDPEFDTPERLKEYAKKYADRDPAKWNFVTSEMIEIDAITEQMGLVFANRNGTIDHNLRSIIIGADGKIKQMYIGNEWPVEEFVEEMKKAAEAK